MMFSDDISNRRQVSRKRNPGDGQIENGGDDSNLRALGRLVSQIVSLATRNGRHGYRRVTALLRNDGWRVNHKRVERIWRQEGLQVLKKQPKRGRLWLNDGSSIRLRSDNGPEFAAHAVRTQESPGDREGQHGEDHIEIDAPLPDAIAVEPWAEPTYL